MINSLLLAIATLAHNPPKSIYDVPKSIKTDGEYRLWALWTRICTQIRDSQEADPETALIYSVSFEVGNPPKTFKCETNRELYKRPD